MNIIIGPNYRYQPTTTTILCPTRNSHHPRCHHAFVTALRLIPEIQPALDVSGYLHH